MAGGTTILYRAVSEAEAKQLKATGRFIEVELPSSRADQRMRVSWISSPEL
jgi:hypothetical protein